MGRRKEGRLEESEDNVRIGTVHNIQTQKRGLRPPRTLYNLNFRKKIFGERGRSKKGF
jgi:hypothetical protein